MDVVVDTLEEAMTLVAEAVDARQPRSIGLIGNAAGIYPELVIRGVTPDVVTDQTPAHDYLAYVPPGSQPGGGRPRCGARTRASTPAAPPAPWRGRWRPCSNSSSAAPRSSTTATTCASAPSTPA